MRKSTDWPIDPGSPAAPAERGRAPKPAAPPLIVIWLLALGAAAALLVSGCGGSGGGSSASVTRSPDGPAMTLASGLYQRGESLSTMAVRGGASYTADGKRHYFKFEALVMKPGRLLFTALDPTGRPAFRLASDGSQLTGVLYGAKQYAVGPATAANFGRFIPLGISPDQLIALMSGSQVRPGAAGARQSGDATELTVLPAGQPDGDQNLWRLRLAGPVEQDPARAVVQSAAFGSARNPAISIKYMNVKEVPREDQGGRPEPFPHSVEIDWTEGAQKSLRVTYEEVRLGLPLDQSHFTLPRPGGFELIQLQ